MQTSVLAAIIFPSMTQPAAPSTAETLYKNYWKGSAEHQSKRRYYERLYSHLIGKLQFPSDGKILDVAGGDGQNLLFLNIQKADILDISDSGLALAEQNGFRTIKGDIEKRFPIPAETYDAALCFEVLEHLYRPNKTIAEIHNVLKERGVLYVAQPNMRADGTYHVRRYYPRELLADLRKSGFSIEWVDYVPAYTMPEAILDDIRRNPSIVRKLIQCVNLSLSLLPWKIRYAMARLVPDRFALIVVVKAVK